MVGVVRMFLYSSLAYICIFEKFKDVLSCFGLVVSFRLVMVFHYSHAYHNASNYILLLFFLVTSKGMSMVRSFSYALFTYLFVVGLGN